MWLRTLKALSLCALAIAFLGVARLTMAPATAIDHHFAASAVPDRVVLTWAANPANSVAVTWRTDTSVREAVVQIVEAGASPRLEEGARAVSATSTPGNSQNGVSHNHSAHINGLRPGTLYAYRVGGGEVWSEWFHHRTAEQGVEPFTFFYFGDAQNDIRSLWSRTVRQAITAEPEARFMVHAGDLVNLRRGNHDTEWGEWFSGLGWVAGTLPSIPATGNHEYEKTEGGSSYTQLSPHWNRQFTLPQEAPEGLEGTLYHIDYQGVRFIVLNSLHALTWDSAELQARWMEPLLEDNPNEWTIVVYHHPMYATRQGRSHPPLQEHWRPLFEKYDVDLVLQGHDHAYGRGRDPEGPVYVVSVSGPKMYDLGEVSEWAVRRAEDTQLYQVIRVEGERLRFEAYTATGELYDAFELMREGNARALLVDHVPGTPERRGREVARR